MPVIFWFEKRPFPFKSESLRPDFGLKIKKNFTFSRFSGIIQEKKRSFKEC